MGLKSHLKLIKRFHVRSKLKIKVTAEIVHRDYRQAFDYFDGISISLQQSLKFLSSHLALSSTIKRKSYDLITILFETVQMLLLNSDMSALEDVQLG